MFLSFSSGAEKSRVKGLVSDMKLLGALVFEAPTRIVLSAWLTAAETFSG